MDILDLQERLKSLSDTFSRIDEKDDQLKGALNDLICLNEDIMDN